MHLKNVFYGINCETIYLLGRGKVFDTCFGKDISNLPFGNAHKSLSDFESNDPNSFSDYKRTEFGV